MREQRVIRHPVQRTPHARVSRRERASSAEKSYLLQRVLDFFPEDAYYALTAMSDRHLAYSEEPLAHRVLVLYEAAALQGETATYLIRSLLSEGRLRYATVENTRDGLRPRVIEREGPTGLIMTTTVVCLHPENETRDPESQGGACRFRK